MDLEIKMLRKKIVDDLNASAVPMEVKRLILVEILAEVKESVDKVLQLQLEEQNKKKESEGEKNGD